MKQAFNPVNKIVRPFGQLNLSLSYVPARKFHVNTLPLKSFHDAGTYLVQCFDAIGGEAER